MGDIHTNSVAGVLELNQARHRRCAPRGEPGVLAELSGRVQFPLQSKRSGKLDFQVDFGAGFGTGGVETARFKRLWNCSRVNGRVVGSFLSLLFGFDFRIKKASGTAFERLPPISP
jgi:hypothetical protein